MSSFSLVLFALAQEIVPFPADHPLAAALASITEAELRTSVEWLASDERRGRNAGEPGADEAADWIAARFEELGLEPMGEAGSYLQPFEFRVRGGDGKRAKTCNVVGLLRGSDATLAENVVVLGAHYDHVGTADSFDSGRIGGALGDDRIWNGADDNASGTAALIEVAEAFVESKLRPKRSLVFVAFGAEEQGLFGSIWYCEHPVVPLEKSVLMLNMDEVGRNRGLPLEMYGVGTLADEGWAKLIEPARGAAPRLTLKLEPSFQSDSDHASFINAGVPAVLLYAGEHPDYHRVTDHADLVEYDRAADVARLVAAIAWDAANTDRKLEFARPQGSRRPPRRLGISSEGAMTAERMAELGFGKDQGGFEVKELDPDGVGAKAGLAEGDVLLEVGGTKIDAGDPATSIRRLIGGAPRGQDVELVVWRGGKKVPLTARWD